MNQTFPNIKFVINDKLYNKDPESSELGKSIIMHSIELIDELGYEQFTFKKLGEVIKSNESSIYRYFDSKHNLLIYLCSWYWLWLDYQIMVSLMNSYSIDEKLKSILRHIVEVCPDNKITAHINETKLQNIVIAEFHKTFMTKAVEEENKMGFYLVYKNIVYRLIKIIVEINPDYQYAESLASTVVQGSLHQHFLRLHLKTITNFKNDDEMVQFYYDLIVNTLKYK